MKTNTMKTKLILVAFVVVMAAFLMISCGDRSPSGEDTNAASGQSLDADEIGAVDPDEVELLSHDVNYSQCWKHQGTFGYSGVEVLLLIRNNSDSAIDAYSFDYRTDADDAVTNLEDPDRPFTASGYIGPHSTGYMFSRIYVSDATDHDQGEITPVAVDACQKRDAATLPGISDVHWYDCEYRENQYGEGDKLFDRTEWNVDCKLTNPAKAGISRDHAIILAAPDLDQMDPEKGAPVFGKWACGRLKRDVGPGKTATIHRVLDQPQFDIGIEDLAQEDLGIYVLETDTSEWLTPDREPEVTKGAKQIVGKAKELAWPFGTEEEVYSYRDGSPTEAYRKALDRVYPDRSSWGKQPRAGASCDVFVGTVVRSAGYGSEFPRGLDEVEAYMEQYSGDWKKYTDINSLEELQPGDVIYQRWERDGKKYGHIMIYLGNGKIANAHYGSGGRYAVIEPAENQIRFDTDTLKVTKRIVYRPRK